MRLFSQNLFETTFSELDDADHYKAGVFCGLFGTDPDDVEESPYEANMFRSEDFWRGLVDAKASITVNKIVGPGGRPKRKPRFRLEFDARVLKEFVEWLVESDKQIKRRRGTRWPDPWTIDERERATLLTQAARGNLDQAGDLVQKILWNLYFSDSADKPGVDKNLEAAHEICFGWTSAERLKLRRQGLEDMPVFNDSPR